MAQATPTTTLSHIGPLTGVPAPALRQLQTAHYLNAETPLKSEDPGKRHPIEEIGKKLRGMMPFVSAGKQKVSEVSGGDTD